MTPRMKKLKPGRYVQVRTGEYYRLSTIGDIVVMETRLADIAVEHFYNDELVTVIRKNSKWDIMRICNEAFTRYESPNTGGSKLYFSR